MDLLLGIFGSKLLFLLFKSASAGRIAQYGMVAGSHSLRLSVLLLLFHWGALSLLDQHLVLVAGVLGQIGDRCWCRADLASAMLALVALALGERELERVFLVLTAVILVVEASYVLGEGDADLGELAVERLGFLDVILPDELDGVEAALDLPLSRPDDGQLADAFFDLVLELGALEMRQVDSSSRA